MERWWVIEEGQFATALQRAADGDDPGVVLMEFVANSDGETVTQGEPRPAASAAVSCSGSARPAAKRQVTMAERFEMLDVWMALGGNSTDFETWMADPKRTDADAWAQLLAAIRGDWMAGDTNPQPGLIVNLVWNRANPQGTAGE